MKCCEVSSEKSGMSGSSSSQLARKESITKVRVEERDDEPVCLSRTSGLCQAHPMHRIVGVRTGCWQGGVGNSILGSQWSWSESSFPCGIDGWSWSPDLG